MQKIRILVFLLLAVLLLSFVSARSFWLIRTPEMMRDIYFNDPYSQSITEPEYVKPLSGYGLKDFSGSPSGFGFKSMDSLFQNLPYNTYIQRGRTPGRISNWDPNVRGYAIMNVFVELFPVESATLIEQGQMLFPAQSAGAARLISNRQDGGDMYTTTVYLQVRDLFGLETDEVYEAWLVDEATGYPLSIGLLPVRSYNTLSSLNFEFTHYAHNYDLLMVTKEPYPDLDPSPGEVILIGNIPLVRMNEPSVSQTSYLIQ